MGQAGLVENLQGMWCDAVAVLVGWEWPFARQAIWQAGTASTAAAVQAWLQVFTCPCTRHRRLAALAYFAASAHYHVDPAFACDPPLSFWYETRKSDERDSAYTAKAVVQCKVLFHLQ